MIEPTFTKTGLDEYHVTNTCVMPDCDHVTKADVPAPAVFRWRQGASVQAAFPELSVSQREALFVSGICGFCWDALFPVEDDDTPYEDQYDEYTSGEQHMADYLNSDSNIAYLNR